MDKACEFCGKRFSTNKGWQRWCTRYCAMKGKSKAKAEEEGRDYKERVRMGSHKTRSCHDCKRPGITDYRCQRCWAKIRGRSVDIDDVDSIFSGTINLGVTI